MIRVGRIVIFLSIICVIVVAIFVGAIYARYRVEYRDIVDEMANKYKIDKSLIFAIIKAESDFDKDAVSSKGAIGLMQILPSTAKWLIDEGMYIKSDKIDRNGKIFTINNKTNVDLAQYGGDIISNLFDARYNIDIGTMYVSYLMNKYNGRLIEVLASYNAGEGNVDAWIKVKCNKNDVDDAVLSIEDISYPETQSYVSKVLKYKDTYEKLYNLG